MGLGFRENLFQDHHHAVWVLHKGVVSWWPVHMIAFSIPPTDRKSKRSFMGKTDKAAQRG
jgi:hypothetical protein